MEGTQVLLFNCHDLLLPPYAASHTQAHRHIYTDTHTHIGTHIQTGMQARTSGKTETPLPTTMARAMTCLSQLEAFTAHCGTATILHGRVTEFTGITAQGLLVLLFPVNPMPISQV